MQENDPVTQIKPKKVSESLESLDKKEDNVTSQTTNNNKPPEQQKGQLSIFKILLFYFAFNQIISLFFPANPKNNPSLLSNIYGYGDQLEMKFFISKDAHLYRFENNKNILTTWSEKNLSYDYNPTNYREKIVFFNNSEIRNLSNLYVHVFVQNLNKPVNISDSEYLSYMMLHQRFDLIEIRKKDDKIIGKNLLFDNADDIKPPEKSHSQNLTKSEGKMKPHLRTKNYVSLIHDVSYYAKNQIPPMINITIIEKFRVYQPILDTKNFWARKKDFTPLEDLENEGSSNITIYFNTYWYYKYLLEVQMGVSNQMYDQWGMDLNNMEEIKEMIMETNLYLVITTMIVSFLHSIFEFLAIKNDIQFWRNVDSHRGLSLRTLYFNFFVEIIVFFYLLDNETSNLVIFFSGIEILVTIWKVMKTTKFKLRSDKKFPWVEMEHKESYRKETEEYDRQAFKYLYIAIAPLYLGYLIYSLIYETYKGWYSFLLHSSVGFIYVFGFIEMTPQLYINYKLKSVEHLPWKRMIYKFLNTIIDDLFAFVISMPWLKRLSCFRDDVIFVIYLYQRWIYRVDKRRTEYGFVKEEKELETKVEGSSPDSNIKDKQE